MIILTILQALLGWLAGVAINHAADVLPRRKTLQGWPNCSTCETQYPFLAWSALLALLSGHQSCRHCGQRRRSFTRSVIVEGLTPALFVFLAWRIGFSLHLGLVSIYTAILILVTVTDLEHRLIFNIVILPSIFLGLILSFFTPLSGFWTFAPACNSLIFAIFDLFFSPPTLFWHTAFIGGAVAFIISFLAWLFAVLLYGHGALGQGDVTLSTFLGLILGFPYILLTLLLTVLLGGIVPLLLLIIGRVNRKSFIPYGPFLTIAGWMMLVWGHEIWRFWFC